MNCLRAGDARQGRRRPGSVVSCHPRKRQARDPDGLRNLTARWRPGPAARDADLAEPGRRRGSHLHQRHDRTGFWSGRSAPTSARARRAEGQGMNAGANRAHRRVKLLSRLRDRPPSPLGPAARAGCADRDPHARLQTCLPPPSRQAPGLPGDCSPQNRSRTVWGRTWNSYSLYTSNFHFPGNPGIGG